MKLLLPLLCALLLAPALRAQVFPVETIVSTGPPAERINLVFLSDGYQAAELPRFVTDVQGIVNTLFTQPPFREYRAYFNVYAVRVPSNQSGAGHAGGLSDCGSQPVATVDNYFGSRFDVSGIHRLLFPSRQSAIASVLAANVPLYDQAFVLVNTGYYGGAGGNVATSSVHPAAAEISIHEIGHSFGQLADEYWAGQQYAAEKPNMTAQSNPALVRWNRWLNTNGVGLYPHTGNPAWFRPHQNCKMQSLGLPFCNVCLETFVERIHALAPPVLSFAPATGTIANPPQQLPLSVSLLRPQPNTLRVHWKRNGVLFARNREQVNVNLTALPAGLQQFTAEITDTVALTRSSQHLAQHVYTLTWELQNTVTGTRVATRTNEYQLSTYPNPVGEALNLTYTLSRPAPVTLTVYAPDGRRLRTLAQGRQPAGQHQYRLTAAELRLRQPGTYTLVFEADGTRLSRQLIKE